LLHFRGIAETRSLRSLAYNSGHTATLRSAQMLGFASHFVCPQLLYARQLTKCIPSTNIAPKKVSGSNRSASE